MTKSINILNLVVMGLAILAVLALIYKYKNEQYIDMGPLGLPRQLPPTIQWYPPIGQYGPGYQGPINQQTQMLQGPPIQPAIMNYPINHGPDYGGSTLGQQPYMYEKQLYPRVPYYKTVGQPCNPNTNNQCGPMATCSGGYCVGNNQQGTVFNIPV